MPLHQDVFLQPLHTERLSLRALTMEDALAIYNLRSHPEVNQYLNRAPCHSLDDAKQFIEKIMTLTQSQSAYYWAITLKGSDQLIGTICLFDLAEDHSQCEIGYELLPEHQGQGIMTEAVQTVINYTFNDLHYPTIVAAPYHMNTKSMQLLEKIGFEPKPEWNADDCIMYILKSTKLLDHH